MGKLIYVAIQSLDGYMLELTDERRFDNGTVYLARARDRRFMFDAVPGSH